MSIFSQLPNNLIMKIIRDTKSSVDFRREHEDNFCQCWLAIKEIGEECICDESSGEGRTASDYPETDQFFSCLFQNDDMTETIIQYRRNKPNIYY